MQYERKLAKGSFWFYKTSHNGKVHRSKCIFKTKGEAKKAEREFLNLLEEMALTPQILKREIKLSELISERLAYLKAKKSIRYYYENEYYFNRLSDAVGDINVKEVTKSMINKVLINYSEELKFAGKDNYAVNSMLRTVKALFNYGIEYLDMEFINPCKNIKPYSVKKELKYIPSDSDIEAVLNVCNAHQRLLIYFVLETGCRINESIKFCLNDIKEDYIVLYTRKSKNSNLIPRKVPKPDCLNNAILKDKVFGDWKDRPHFLEKKCKELSIKVFGWHCLRHRYASLLSKQGMPLFEISQRLGHSSVKTTEIYLQLLP